VTDTGAVRGERPRDAAFARLLLVVGGVGAAVAVPLVVALVFFVVLPERQQAYAHARGRMRSDAEHLRSSVLLFMGQEPGAKCATLEDLRRGRVLDPADRITDAWDQPYRITCDGDDILVVSDGPDGLPGTADDID
jgi:hypothetical protein